MTSDWPFDDPPNVAVITTKRIIREDYPILGVVHEEEDGEWQFLDGFDFTVADGSIVSLRSIVNRDATILELADLPLGWYAERANAEAAWRRARCQQIDELEQQ